MTVPILDWQFWVVTAAAAGAAWMLVAPWLGQRERQAAAACARCALAGGSPCRSRAMGQPTPKAGSRAAAGR